MTLVDIVLTLIGIGVLLAVANKYLPMNDDIKRIMNAVVIIGVVLWLLQAFGILSRAKSVRVGQTEVPVQVEG